MTINKLINKSILNPPVRDNMDGTYSIKIKALKENAVRSEQYNKYYILECDVCGETCPKRIDYAPKLKRTYCKQECFSIMQKEMNERKAYEDGWREKKNGYMYKRLWDDIHQGEWVMQHRWIMAQHVGWEALINMTVHHIDMIKTNNDISNLWLCTDSQHKIAHNSFNVLCAEGMKKAVQFRFNVETGKYYLITKGK